MSTARRKHEACIARRSVTITALTAALALSSFLTAASLASPRASWAVWFCLIPLMWAIRSLSPAAAALAGAGWGLGVWGAILSGIGPASSSSTHFLVALPLFTATYAGLGALTTRAIGFNPLILAVGWVLVEVALKPLRLSAGLLISGQASGSVLDELARFLGYALAALLVVGVNASLLKLLCGLHVRPVAQRLIELPCTATLLPCVHESSPTPRWAFRQAYPRGPPFLQP